MARPETNKIDYFPHPATHNVDNIVCRKVLNLSTFDIVIKSLNLKRH